MAASGVSVILVHSGDRGCWVEFEFGRGLQESLTKLEISLIGRVRAQESLTELETSLRSGGSGLQESFSELGSSLKLLDPLWAGQSLDSISVPKDIGSRQGRSSLVRTRSLESLAEKSLSLWNRATSETHMAERIGERIEATAERIGERLEATAERLRFAHER